MPRLQRIQYENAFYYVINRGKARSTVFHDERYYDAFLKTLEESHKRFDAVSHVYCLMGNHYHLLIETPRAKFDHLT
ncbi:MAG: transposase [Gammaproteobacteria bacterium]|nr:transposase [Gammaproteobacteria bacterium]